MINKTKNDDSMFNNPDILDCNIEYDNIDEIYKMYTDWTNGIKSFKYEKTIVEYTARFFDEPLKNYEGFYWDGSEFIEITDGNIGESEMFGSIDEILLLAASAKEYHQDVSHVSIQKTIMFEDSNGNTLLYISCGHAQIELFSQNKESE